MKERWPRRTGPSVECALCSARSEWGCQSALVSIGTSRLGDVSLITLVAVAAAVLVTAVMAPTVAAFVLRREGGLLASTPRPLVEEGVA